MKKTIGYTLLSLPIVGLIALHVQRDGLVHTAVLLGLIALVAAVGYAGFRLIEDDEN